MTIFIQQVINGLTLGSVFALVALGLTMIYGILHVANFAHGSLYMLGGYVIYLLLASVEINYWLAILIAAVIFAFIGMVIERLVFRPLAGKPPLNPFIAAIGLIFILNNIALAAWGASYRRFPPINIDSFHLLGATVTVQRVIVLGITIILIVLLYLFLKKTAMGSTIEAVAQDPEGAELVGINVNRVGAVTFALGTGLAAVAAGLIGPLTLIYPTMGDHITLYAFVIIILGGMGSIPGAIFGGYLLGLLKCLSAAYISVAYNEVVVFAAMIAVLAIKPTGLFGRE